MIVGFAAAGAQRTLRAVLPLGVGCALSMLLLSSCSLSAREAPIAPPSPPLSGDYLRLQGTWVVTYNESRSVSLPEMAGALFIFDADRFRLGTDKGFEWYAIDETSEPKKIDFYDGHSPVIRGIYRLDGNELAICSDAPGAARPTSFATSVFAGTVLTKTTRQQGATD